MADFYARTTGYWTSEAENTIGMAAANRGESMSSKELKGEAFNLAKERYKEIQPVLDRLNELDSMLQQESERHKEKKLKKEKKSSKRERLK